MGFFNLFGGDDSNSSNSTTSNNTSNTSTTNTSYNTSTNTSNNSTVNDTNTLSQDRRIATDHGLGISADGSTLTTTNSGNNITTTNSTDSHNYNYSQVMSDYGSVMGGIELGKSAIASNQTLALKTVDASRWITDAGLELGQSNLDFLQHVADSNAASARNAISEVVAASGNAMNQVVGIASKPLNAQDPQHILVIVGLVVIGAVIFSKVKV